MKKLLIKLLSIAITSSLLPSMIISIQPSLKETIKLRRDVNLNKEDLSHAILHRTYDIGKIESNREEHIEEGFRNYLLTNTNNHINIEECFFTITNIKYNHADINILNETQEQIELIVRVNFITNNYTLNSILLDTNLGDIPDNCEETIINILYQRNRILFKTLVGIRAHSITTNSALINYYVRNFDGVQDGVEQITITFRTTNYMTRNLVKNTNLGFLPDARPETIINRVRERNPEIPADFNLGSIDNIVTLEEQESIRTILATLTNSYEPQEVPQVTIYESNNLYFHRPASQQEIDESEYMMTFTGHNRVNLIFYLTTSPNNTQTNSSASNDESDENNISNSLFCLDSEINKNDKSNEEITTDWKNLSKPRNTVVHHNRHLY